MPVGRCLTSRYWNRRLFYRSTSGSLYLKCASCVIITYLLNVMLGFQYYWWPDKIFEKDYYLSTIHIDIEKLEENKGYLGPPKNTLPISYRISNKYLCGRDESEVIKQTYLLILVKSAVENKQARQAIRITWGEKHRLEQDRIKLAFVIGISKLNISVDSESKRFNDIIQIDKIDDYYYNTYKMVMMLRWITNHCLAKLDLSDRDYFRNYVLIIDDDYYLDVESLVEYLKSIDRDEKMTVQERQTFITGYVYEKSRPRRYLNSRWYISMADYPYNRYPPYVTAGCFLMTRYNARLFYMASKYIPIFPFDDVYIGILAFSMSVHFVINNQRFSSYSSRFDSNQTVFLSPWRWFINGEINRNKEQICVHGYRGEQLLNVWNKLYETKLTIALTD